MIKFFRKIRQRLLTENKFSKYLLYAIGEIVLVVIGILIALQINNWNENQKKSIIESEILTELKSCLERDLEDVIWNLNSESEKLTSQKVIINWIEEDLNYDDSLETHFVNISYVTFFNDNPSTYNDLKQLGMRTISNDSLRGQISKLYDMDYEQYRVYNSFHSKLNEKLNSNNGKYFNGIDWKRNKMKLVDADGLKTDEVYIHHLKTMKGWNELFTLDYIPDVVFAIKKTIKMIEYELESRGQ